MKTNAHLFAAAVCGCTFFSHLSLAGSWVEVPEPVVASSGIGGIAVVSDKDVWAAGSQFDVSYKTLTEHWDGTSWSVVPSPNEFPTFSVLNGVAALAKNDVWAVGYGVHGDFKTIAMHWDGSAWTLVQTPNVAFRDSFLHSISAVAADDIWAVGSSDTTSGSHRLLPLAMHWDGSAWTIIPSTPLTSGTTFLGVHAIAADDVWAVGNDVSSQNFSIGTTYTMHWDGTAWSTVPSPNGPLPFNALYSVSGASGNDVWAVGVSSDSTTGDSQTLAMHWDGAVWTVMSTAPLTGASAFNAVTALSANRVWAVGSTNGQSLIERWNGRTWTVAALPPLQDPSGLSSIESGRKGALWAAGSQTTGQLFLKMTR